MDKVSKSLYRVMLRTSKTFDTNNFNIVLADRIRNTWKVPILEDDLEKKINGGFQCLRQINTNKKFVKDFLTYNENSLYDKIDGKMTKYIYKNEIVNIYEGNFMKHEGYENFIVYK